LALFTRRYRDARSTKHKISLVTCQPSDGVLYKACCSKTFQHKKSVSDSLFPYIFISSSKWDLPLQIVNKLQPFHETIMFIPTRVALIWKVTPCDVVDKYRLFGIYLQNYKVYVCICMYVCVCVYVCMYVRTYVRMYVYMYVCTFVCMNVYTYVCVNIYVCVYVCMYVLCMCVCVYVYKYYVNTCTHFQNMAYMRYVHTITMCSLLYK